MKTESVKLIKNKVNIYEFEATIEGINPTEVEFRFILTEDGRQVIYNCLRKDGTNWFVTLPKGEQLTQPLYQFTIEAIIDGYWFKTIEGQLEVSEKEIDVKTSHVEYKPDTIVKPVETPVEKKVEKPAPDVIEPKAPKEVEVPAETKDSTDIAQRIIDRENQRRAESNKTIPKDVKKPEHKKVAQPKLSDDEREEKQRKALELLNNIKSEDAQKKKDEQKALVDQTMREIAERKRKEKEESEIRRKKEQAIKDILGKK